MRQRLIEQVGRSTRLRVLNELKRTPAGLAVRDLSDRLGMSYMGVKDVCLDLEKRGLLDTWRDPVKTGRPRMLYRITERANDLFPTASNPLTIEILRAAHTLFGASAPEKLLLISFQRKIAEYSGRVSAATLTERARRLSGLRDAEGYMSNFHEEPGQMRIVEHHSPILDVLRAFPPVEKLECEMFEKLLGAPVRREESGKAGLFCATFAIIVR